MDQNNKDNKLKEQNRTEKRIKELFIKYKEINH